MDFTKFVTLIIDQKLDHKTSIYLNERLQDCDQVIRKIDTLPPRIEKNLCELLLLQIRIKKEADQLRQEVVANDQFICQMLFKSMVFDLIEEPAKQITSNDVQRFFRLNRLLIEQDRVENIFFKRILGEKTPFDF